tara:strand:+ start:2152 stop:2901 length:750 start_codon:yes stop_codon:yes gene_type:complete
MPLIGIGQQKYNQMLTNDVEWQLTSCYNGCITDVYYIDGDTIYNGYNYYILNGYHFISKTFWLREDIQNQTVYMSFVYNNIRKEVLLYDFDLEIGDSINISNPISPFVANPGYYIVDSLVSLELQNGLYYEVFYLSSSSVNINESAVWIEGIGSLSLINAPGGTPNVNGAGKLSCYFNKGDLIYSQLDSIDNCILVNQVLSSELFNSRINNRKLINVVDILGRKTTPVSNILLFYIYNDGTVEKKIIIE